MTFTDRCWLVVALLLPALTLATPAPDRQQALRYLLLQDCGSCHGMTLKGGLGPALTPQALAGKSREWLSNSILYGRPGTAMPPWQDFIEQEEADWLVQQLLQGLEK